MYKIAIVEDEEAERKYLENCLKKYEEENDVKFEMNFFSDGIDFIEQYKTGYDIVFMDIELPKYDGMSAAQKLREVDGQVRLVFVTKSVKYAIKGYEVDAMYYLVKPIKYFPFSVKLDKIIRSLQGQKLTITVKVSGREGCGGIMRLVIDDIYYVEVCSNYLKYHTSSGIYEERNTMKVVEERLNPFGFCRCNNYCLVNLKYISELNKNSIVVNGVDMEISRSRKKGFLNAVTEHAWRIG